MLKTGKNAQSPISSLHPKLMTIFKSEHVPSAFSMNRSPESTMHSHLGIENPTHMVPINSTVPHPKLNQNHVNQGKHEEVYFLFRKNCMCSTRLNGHGIVCFSYVAWESYSTELNVFNQIKTEHKLNRQESAASVSWDVYSLQLNFIWPMADFLYVIIRYHKAMH